mmetsp:Transcript_100702/g.288611  ORF Transcript_100702/g.288611 Transcript_100702/m.288611 type:complete len:97 (+) Transcript_100702:1099-1389(+)
MRTAGHAQAGSTATTVLLLGDRAYCGNVGDSRTVLCRSGEAVPLSDDHKPSREDEAARIKVSHVSAPPLCVASLLFCSFCVRSGRRWVHHPQARHG